MNLKDKLKKILAISALTVTPVVLNAEEMKYETNKFKYIPGGATSITVYDLMKMENMSHIGGIKIRMR